MIRVELNMLELFIENKDKNMLAILLLLRRKARKGAGTLTGFMGS